jgi:hypothetical protein
MTYYANGKRVELQEYLEVMLAAGGKYKQDVVLIDGGTVHVLVAEVPAPLRAA